MRRLQRLTILAIFASPLLGTGCSPFELNDSTEVSDSLPTDDGGRRVLVVYHSLRGSTETMAQAVAKGAGQVPGVSVTTKKVADVTKADLDAAHGIVIGCPTHFANIPADVKVALDHWAWKERVDLTDKVGGAFATGGNVTGGKEHVVVSLLLYMLNNRMVVVGPIHKEGPGGYGEFGASATTGSADPGVSELELDAATKLGRRVARVASSR